MNAAMALLLMMMVLGCGAARGDEAHTDEAAPPPSGAGARCGAGTELAADGYCVVAERGRPSDGGAAAVVLAPGASSLFVDPGSSVGLDWSPPLDLLALLEGDDGWMGGNYLKRTRDVGLALAGFDYPGAFRVVNITVRSDAPFQVIVTDGQKKGRDVCFNQRGRDVHGDSPWAKLPFPRKVTYSLADSVAAMWEHAGSDSTSWLGRKVQQSLLQEASWVECSFTVSRFRPITFRVDGSAAEISAATVRDDLRILSQATSMALLLNAEMVSESMVVWCSSGVFGGSVLLTILIVIMVMKKVDNNRRGVPLIVVLGGGIWQLLTTFWNSYWQYVVGVYVVTGLFGCYYCYRHPLGEASTRMFALVLRLLALWLAYSSTADSGAGLVLAATQLIGHELLDARRSVVFTLNALIVTMLQSLGIVDEQRLVNLGMMRQHQLFAQNNYLDREDLHTPRDRMRAFEEDGREMARTAVEALQLTPEYREWERQREGARRQTLYRHVKHVGGALLLVGLGLYMAYLGGFVEVPKRLERFQF